MFGHTPSTMQETALLLGMPRPEEGIEVAGCPISTPALVTHTGPVNPEWGDVSAAVKTESADIL
jgi:hypothetical protein